MLNRKFFAFAAILVGATLAAFAGPATAPADEPRFEAARLGVLDTEILSKCFSPDGRHVALGFLSHGKRIVMIDGRQSPPYDVIVEHSPHFRDGDVLEFLAANAGVLYRVKTE